MADTFDAIADSTRREILLILLERGGTGEIAAAELAELLGVTVPTATKHLGVLREQGYVSAREEGRARYFRLELAPFDALQAWLAPFVDDAFDVGPVSSATDVAHEAAAFNAWAGTEVGANLGRALADRSNQARTAFHGASEKMTQALPGAVTRRWTNRP
ncbi:ArsR/SmtB family transcription factor [Conyzicola sp.]|uniref:ArsR/SmtB family transcription factor n=1 Tax=Conyzicola sp. TaxID=1969404 RepID=UPI003989AD7B